MPEMAGTLPKGWPPLAPSAALVQKLAEGKVLKEEELLQLKRDADHAEKLEATDPDFMRACRRYRAQCAEEDRIIEVQQELESKSKTIEAVRERVDAQRAAKRQARLRKMQRSDQTRQEVKAAREQHKQKLLERIALTERRELVRTTIQKALVAQSRNDGHAERIMFTHPKMLGDNPGPGAYALPNATGASDKGNFGKHPDVDVRIRHDPRPGPGSYDPRYSTGPAITMGGLPSEKKSERAAGALPGPGSYNLKLPRKPGGTISSHVVKSSLDQALEQSKDAPGPGAYELAPLSQGKTSTMSGRTRGANDLQILRAARRPGPGTYDPGKGERRNVRGGAMGVDDERGRLLPSLAPGPGAYHQTATIKQEIEMRQLSKQVVKLVRSRNGPPIGSRSAPGGVRNERASASEMLEAGMSLGNRGSLQGGRTVEPVLEEESAYG